MQVRCIQAAYGHEVDDLVDVPDGAAVSPVYFEPVKGAAAPALPLPAPAPADIPKGGA